MNAIEELQEQLLSALPGEITCALDPGEREGAPWFLNCRMKNRLAIVEWRPREEMAFSVSDGAGSPMGGADAIVADAPTAFLRALAILDPDLAAEIGRARLIAARFTWAMRERGSVGDSDEESADRHKQAS